MNVRCQYCGSGVEVDRPVGVQPCVSCGATVVWPEIEGSEAVDSERARVVAARRGLRYLTLPSTLRSIWTETSGAEPYCRGGYNIERREVVLRLSPGQGTRASDVVIVPDASHEDPWQDDPAGLVQRTASVCVCPTCMGSKKTTCPACAGQSRVRCQGCAGSGKVAGQRGPKNCPNCRGKGNVKCPQCRSGKVACGQCGASGRVRAWLEVVASQSTQVVVDPRTEGASVHRRLDDVADFERPPDQYENVLVADTGWTAPGRYRIPPRVEPKIDARRDRLQGVRFQVFRSPVFRFEYALATGAGVVAVAGRAPTVSPQSNLRPLAVRALASTGVLGFGQVAALVLWLNYVGRAPWFAQEGVGGWVLLTACLAAMGLAGLVHTLLLRRGRGTMPKIASSCAAIGAGAVGVALAWTAVAPSPEQARALLERGELEAAALHIEALHRERDQAAEGLQADLTALQHQREDADHLAEVTQAATLSAAVALYDRPWHQAEVKAKAKADLVTRASAQIEADYAAHQPKRVLEAAQLVVGLDESVGIRGAVLAEVGTADACLAKGDWACAQEALAKAKPERARAAKQFDASVGRLVIALVAAHEAAEAETDQSDADPSEVLAAAERGLRVAELHETWKAPEAESLSRSKLVKAQRTAQRKVDAAERKADRAAQRAAARRARAEREASRPAPRPRQRGGGCCKVCSKGKPCGDSCIARNKTCNRGPGCAC